MGERVNYCAHCGARIRYERPGEPFAQWVHGSGSVWCDDSATTKAIPPGWVDTMPTTADGAPGRYVIRRTPRG